MKPILLRKKNRTFEAEEQSQRRLLAPWKSVEHHAEKTEDQVPVRYQVI